MFNKPELMANFKNKIREKMKDLLERTKKFEYETYPKTIIEQAESIKKDSSSDSSLNTPAASSKQTNRLTMSQTDLLNKIKKVKKMNENHLEQPRFSISADS